MTRQPSPRRRSGLLWVANPPARRGAAGREPSCRSLIGAGDTPGTPWGHPPRRPLIILTSYNEPIKVSTFHRGLANKPCPAPPSPSRRPPASSLNPAAPWLCPRRRREGHPRNGVTAPFPNHRDKCLRNGSAVHVVAISH